jgi:hypothetical protein
MLLGRRSECAALDELMHAVRAGQSRVLVLLGEPGVGRTALLEYVADPTSGFRFTHAAGVESEMELVYAGMHQLCEPMLGRLDRLPGPQRAALETAFGLNVGGPPDRFLIGLAMLSLLSDAAEDRPLLCVVDDAQWLDAASAQVLAFVARRLHSESVARPACLGVPRPGGRGRRRPDRCRVRSSGASVAASSRFRQRHSSSCCLPRPSRSGTRRSCGGLSERLGIAQGSAAPAEAEGLVRFRGRVRFRHPLVRSAIYQAAPEPERRAVHRALAETLLVS